ncbi:hypothetical protein Lser_V15G09664 [Lactuca serriola]
MTRRCSHCSNNGHNSRTCPNRGLKLFGVRITDGSIRKSASMGNLTHYTGSGSGGGAFTSLSGGGGTDLDSPGDTPDHNAAADGYGSEDFVAGSSSGRERKKGVPWTEEEHRMFLMGLQKLGKGDWRGIARNYVISRTPTQVASHAQKYFIRQTNMSRRKRRSSLFDMVADDPLDAGMNMMGSHSQSHDGETQSVDNPKMCVPTVEEKEEVEEEEEEDDDDECESMDSASSNIVEPGMNLVQEAQHYCYPAAMFPAYYEFIPVAIPFWGGPAPAKTESHEVLKPTAVHSKTPINVDQLVGLSKLSLGDSIGDAGPNSLKLLGSLSRQSAFHASSSSDKKNNNSNNDNTNNNNPRTSSGSMPAHSCTVGG